MDDSVNAPSKGEAREGSLDRSVYFGESYFKLQQLMALTTQLYMIHKMAPKSVLEIGIGNGFVSSFLRASGVPVTTVDINPELNPDICAPISDLAARLEGARFDLVVCCEVLEHMPLHQLDDNLSYLRNAGDRLYLTLPSYTSSFGLGGVAKLPRLKSFFVDLNVSLPAFRRLEGGPHYWEVGSHKECTKTAIVRRLSATYGRVKQGRFALNPYHLYFQAE